MVNIFPQSSKNYRDGIAKFIIRRYYLLGCDIDMMVFIKKNKGLIVQVFKKS